MTYYAICNANGPISVRLNACSLEEAQKEFESSASRAWIDDARTDAEDDLGISGEGMSEVEFAAEMEAAGYEPVDYPGGAVQGGWVIWAAEDQGMITIRVTTQGHTYPVSRDVRDVHPKEVHDALGTGSESELQAHLDQCHVDDWYDVSGNHLGPDMNGLEMFQGEVVSR